MNIHVRGRPITVVHITPEQRSWALTYGKELRNRAVSRRMKDYSSLYNDSMRISLLGAVGEMAFSEWSGIPLVKHFEGFHTIPDFLPDHEVKTGEPRHYKNRLFGGPPKLMFRPSRKERDEWKQWLVMATDETLLEWAILGWMYGYEMKDPDFWDYPDPDREGCYVRSWTEIHAPTKDDL